MADNTPAPMAADQCGQRGATAEMHAIPRWVDDELGRRRLRRRVWRGRIIAAAGGLATAGGLWLAGRETIAVAALGTVALVSAVILGLSALRRLLSVANPVAAVARAILEEAVGTRLSVLLVMLLIVALPTLPLVLDPTERLAYRMQFFINWALSGSFVLLAIVSIAICCTSLCGDIESRRIHMALSKPMRSWEYLLGKWVGVVLLDLLLIICVAVGTYTFVQTLRRSRTADNADLRAVEEQVLTARLSARPIHPRREEFEAAIEKSIELVREEDPTTFDMNPAAARKHIRTQQVYLWHMVSPDLVSSYLFTGLDEAKQRAPVVQLRLEPFADNSKTSRAEVQFALWLNERPFPVKNGKHEEYTLAAGQVHTLELPSVAIADDGTLLVTIANRNRQMPGDPAPTGIGFNPGKGLEILHRVGSFEWNLVRACVVIWAKLALLSAAAIAAAALLSLPVAMLAGFMVFIVAVASGFIADAIDIYTGVDSATPTLVGMLRLRAGMLLEQVGKLAWWDAMKTMGAWLSDCFLVVVPAFSDYDSITEVATGRLVPLWEVGWAMAILGVSYPVMLLAFGWFWLQRRDLVSSAS